MIINSPSLRENLGVSKNLARLLGMCNRPPRLILLVLAASLGLVSACSSTSGSDAASAMGKKVKVAPGQTGSSSGSTGTSGTTTTTTTTTVYDTSIGIGVDGSGYANLPLRPGAQRYFVNSATGSDTNGCTGAQQPGTPVRTIFAALRCVQAGSGDQILVAEGTSYSEGLPNLDSEAGYSAAYPTVLQSYDPSDPTNESKYGRAANGRRPVVNTGANIQQDITCCRNPAPNYLAIRGFDINPGDKSDMTFTFVGSSSYVLLENNLFRYTAVSFDKGSQPQAEHHVIRKNAFYGEWSTAAHAQGVYDSGTDGIVIEDNVFWHVGWKLGVSRDTDPTLGGPTMFRHPVYMQDDTTSTVRRNLFMDGSADGGSVRGNVLFTENVSIDNPIGVGAGGGTNYNVMRPNGVNVEVSYNAFLGAADLNSANPRGGGIGTMNGTPGSSVHHNLLARSNVMDGAAFAMNALFNQPSYTTWDSNVVYQWANGADEIFNPQNTTYPGQIFTTYTNNLWDAPSSGTNTNVGTHSFTNPYTEAQLFAALGCVDKATCAARMIETPELGWGPRARAILWQGYGMP